MNHHCSNSTDRRIFLFFLEVISDLEGVLKHLESSRSSQNTSCESLDTCREILGPNSNISQLRAQLSNTKIKHNEIAMYIFRLKFYIQDYCFFFLFIDFLSS